MIKIVCLVLFAVNLIFFAVHRGYVGHWIGPDSEPERVNKQIDADAIVIVGQPRSPASAGGAVPAVAGSTAQPAAAAQPSSGQMACIEFGPVADADLSQFESSLQSLNLGARLNTRTVFETAQYLVYLPSQGSFNAASRKAEELRQRGIRDFAILQEGGEFRFAISLGILSSEANAQKLVAELRERGVANVRVAPRQVSTARTMFRVAGVDAATKLKLEEIANQWPNISFGPCG